MPLWRVCAVLVAMGAAPATAPSLELTVRLPQGMHVTSAMAVARDMKLNLGGKIAAGAVVFSNLLPDTPYDVELRLADGTLLCGVDMAWYNEEPPQADAGPLTDDDRQGITSIVRDVPAFENRKDILLLRGDHDRAVGLVQLIRDKDFHAGGGNAIWRVELWYFKFRYGGWEAIRQQNKVLRRVRFGSKAELERTLGRQRWVPELGGIRLTAAKTVELPPVKRVQGSGSGVQD